MRHFTSILILLCGTLLPAVAGAATGVSEERVSLPEGPGSLEGIGENVELNLNMGAMIHRVPIQVPEGFAGLTPQVTLSYSSSNGSSVVGMGWSLSMPSIERLTVRGLPEYDLDDELSVNGGEELVLITGTDPPVYRSRFEGSFVRYTWHDAGDGSQGYFTAEHPDGRIGYYGADASGSLVADARVGGEKGTFRYHLVEIVDRYGHRLRYTWGLHGNVSLMNHIGWVFSDGTNPVYELTFEYDGERYDRLSDCRGGFEELLEHRLEQVNVLARGTRIRRYELSYEDYVTSGGFSRLTGVQLYGLEEFRYGIHHGFAYSRALGVDCAEGEDCGQPYVVSLGQLGVDMAKGETTLLDINGDALPDILNTSSTEEKHRFFMNVLSADGTHAFASPAQSALGTSSDLISSSFVHVLDVDGDGFTDLLNAKTGETLFNRGSGDWAEGRSLWEGAGGFPELGAEGAMASVKFNDVNGDKRIDLVYSRHNDDANDTMVFFNDLAGGFVEAPSQPIGLGFENPAVELNDMNGDSLLDIVQVMSSGLRYRLSYGRGSWSEWKEVIFEDFSLNEQDVVTAELEDMNGDGLADLSLTKGAEVQYWLNRNGTTFDSLRTITSADVDGDLPERKETTTLLHADMNGNGSSDFVWVQGDESGAVYYLELFPVRPNLLAKVTNGIGRVSEITYVSSVQERARDEATDPWKHPLPHPMTVVKQVDEHDELTNVHTVTEYSYRDGYYDGVEKRFRGYSVVQARKAGDELQEAGASRDVYNPGVGDPYVAGKLMEQEHSSGERSVVFKTFEYDECEVAGVPEDGLRFRVRHICRKHQSEQWREGTAEAEWATVETSWEHDGYGNVTLESRHGVTSVGGGACAACEGDAYAGTPCGEKCLGDEAYTRTEYTAPQDNEDRWIVSTPKRVRTFGVATAEGEPAGDVYTETLTYYDGPDFEGLPHGQVTHGAVTRVVERLDTSGATREKVRNRIDEHGNVVETLDPLGAPGGDGHRRLYTMDEDGLKVVRVDVFNSGAGGAYTLRQEIQYDPLWAKPVEATAWMVVEGDEVKDARRPSYYAYDELGRIVSITHPGSTPDKPTEEYEYNLASPVTSIVIKKRSVAGEDPDLETVRCVDGRGRTYQERTRVAEGSWRVTGFTAFNLQGNQLVF